MAGPHHKVLLPARKAVGTRGAEVGVCFTWGGIHRKYRKWTVLRLFSGICGVCGAMTASPSFQESFLRERPVFSISPLHPQGIRCSQNSLNVWVVLKIRRGLGLLFSSVDVCVCVYMVVCRYTGVDAGIFFFFLDNHSYSLLRQRPAKPRMHQ